MNSAIPIQILLRNRGAPLDRAEWRQVAARVGWVMDMTDQWRAAMRERDERCTEAVGRLAEEEFERFYEAEQAKVDAIQAQIHAVIERDLSPPELYFGGI